MKYPITPPPELVEKWAREVNADVWFHIATQAARWGAADPLERQAAPVPVAVSERSTQIEDLAADAVGALRYIEQNHGRLYGVGWDRVYEKADRLRPALPLPSGEVEP